MHVRITSFSSYACSGVDLFGPLVNASTVRSTASGRFSTGHCLRPTRPMISGAKQTSNWQQRLRKAAGAQLPPDDTCSAARRWRASGGERRTSKSTADRRSTPETPAHDQREHPEYRSHQPFDLRLQVSGGSSTLLRVCGPDSSDARSPRVVPGASCLCGLDRKVSSGSASALSASPRVRTGLVPEVSGGDALSLRQLEFAGPRAGMTGSRGTRAGRGRLSEE